MSSRTWTPVVAALCTSAKDAALPDDTCRLFFSRLLLIADSYGCVGLAEHVIHAKLWPLHDKPVSEVSRSIRECCKVGLLSVHADGTRRWIRIPDWENKAGKVMRLERRGKQEFQDATDANRVEYSGSTAEDSGSVPESHSRAERDIQTERLETDQKEKQKEEPPTPFQGESPSAPVPEPKKPKRVRKLLEPEHVDKILQDYPALNRPDVLEASKSYLAGRIERNQDGQTERGLRIALKKLLPVGADGALSVIEQATAGGWLGWPAEAARANGSTLGGFGRSNGRHPDGTDPNNCDHMRADVQIRRQREASAKYEAELARQKADGNGRV